MANVGPIDLHKCSTQCDGFVDQLQRYNKLCTVRAVRIYRQQLRPIKECLVNDANHNTNLNELYGLHFVN